MSDHAPISLGRVRVECKCGWSCNVNEDEERLSSRVITDLLLDRFNAHAEAGK